MYEEMSIPENTAEKELNIDSKYLSKNKSLNEEYNSNLDSIVTEVNSDQLLQEFPEYAHIIHAKDSNVIAVKQMLKVVVKKR